MQFKYKLSKDKWGGTGMFTEEDIKKGSVIWKWDVNDHTVYNNEDELKKELENLTLEEARFHLDHTYSFKRGNDQWVVYEKTDGKYFNHSSTDYNVGCDYNQDPNGYNLYALRDIKKNEEIITNYKNDGLCEEPDWFYQIRVKYGVPNGIEFEQPAKK